MKIPSHERHEPRKRVPFSYVTTFVFLAVVCVAVVFAFFGFYVDHWYGGAAKHVPLPAFVMDGDIVWYGEIATMAQMMDALQAGAHLENADPFEAAVKRVQENHSLEQMAKELQVEVTKKDQDAFLIDEDGLRAFLAETGWNEEEYRRFIIRPLLLSQKLDEAVKHEPRYQTEAHKRIDDMRADMDLGFDFTDLAVQRSDDFSSANGGYLGFFTKDELPETYKQVFDVPIDSVTGVLEGDDFFAIARVYDEINGEEGREKVGLQVVTVKKDGLATALQQFMEGRRVRRLIW